jgi:phage shock protein PspC (stress-responsive transcriptional regulator)
MTTNDEASTAGPSTPAPPAAPSQPRPPLRRSATDRKIAGVCGGLGRYTGIDPIVFRVVLAVLAFFGGVGLLIYLAAWLFLPADGDTASPVEALLGRGHSSTSSAKTVLLAVAGALALAFVVDRPSLPLLAAAVVGVVLLVRHRQPGGLAAMAGGPVNPAEAPASTVPPPYAPHGPYGPPYAAPPPMPVPPRRKRSPLGRIVLSAMLVVLGVMALVDKVHGVAIPPAAYAAAALAVIGTGLVVGAWFGHARGLIVLGILLSFVVGTASAFPTWSHSGSNTGNRRWAPVSAGEINAGYRLGAGDATLDLTKVDFTDASVTTTVHLGVGQVRVMLPSTVDTTVHGSTGIGALHLLGKHSEGTGLRETVTDLGTGGAGGGSLKLFIDDGIGDVEVTRE